MGFPECSLESFKGQAPKDSTGSPFLPSVPPYLPLASFFQCSPRVWYRSGEEKVEENLCSAKGEENEVGRWARAGHLLPRRVAGSCGKPALGLKAWVCFPGMGAPDRRLTALSPGDAFVRCLSLRRPLTKGPKESYELITVTSCICEERRKPRVGPPPPETHDGERNNSCLISRPRQSQ